MLFTNQVAGTCEYRPAALGVFGGIVLKAA
jgi:hypothetical protein